MYLKRKIDEYLLEWKKNEERLPLIIKGARQIGKTESINHFAEQNYSNIVSINFVLEPKYKTILSDGYAVEDIIKNISMIDTSKRFIAGDTVIIFDELQEFPDIATALKSFRIDGRFDVICSGFLLGINYRKIHSNSVGYKTDYEMFSMDFEEFLWAKGYSEKHIEDILQHMQTGTPFSETELSVYKKLFLEYCVLGGMPAVVKVYIEKNLFTDTLEIQRQIQMDYEEDIRKYAEGLEQTKIVSVYRNVPVQLAKENKKFIYGLVKEGARAREYEIALSWLIDCGLVYQVNRVNNCKVPLSAYQDFNAFKLYLLDVGLLGAMADLDSKTILEGNDIFEEFKGSLTEPYVLCQLKECTELNVFYWSSEKGIAEIDFIVQIGKNNVPIEVKSNENLQAKSLKSFVEKYNTKINIRTSMANFRVEEWLTNIPLYSIGNIERIIK